jgi:hypothetical protein
MTDITPRTGAPLLAAAQAQKHVTHNEALYQFDAFLCARFIDRTHTAPPSSPADGDTYLIAASATGAWLGQDGNVAYSADGAWRFYAPFAGLVAYVSAETKLVIYNGSAWVDFASTIALQNLPMVGVNTTADSTNKLAVQSNAVLFSDLATGSGGTGDIRATLSKQASGNTASFLFQDAFSGRAEIGLTGDDNFHFKVSSDGSTWHDAMDIAASTGSVSIASADINGGSIDGTAVGASTPSTGAFTTLSASNAISFSTGSHSISLTPTSGNITISPSSSGGNVAISPAGKLTISPASASSTLDNTAIGGTTPAPGSFTALAATSFTLNTVANGSVATALSSVGPTGAHATVQEWFAVKNASGTTRYIPAF